VGLENVNAKSLIFLLLNVPVFSPENKD